MTRAWGQPDTGPDGRGGVREGVVAPRPAGAGELAELERLDGVGRELADKARASSTRTAYDRDWARFRDWCAEHHLEAMPADPRTLTRFLAALTAPRTRAATEADRLEDVVEGRVPVGEGLRPSTIARYLASISVRHQAQAPDEPNPAANAHVRAVMAGIRRDYADRPTTSRPTKQKTAARTEAVRTLVGPDPLATPGFRPGPQEPGYPRLLRDRALILIGWKAALRRSELSALDLADVRVEADGAGHDGLTITLDRSKTDQTAAGATVWIAGSSCSCAATAPTTSPGARPHPSGEGEAEVSTDLCPVAAWRAWTVLLAGQTPRVVRGPAWRPIDRHDHLRATRLSGRSIADLIATRAHAFGLEGDWGGHSLRRGFATEAYARGNPETEIMRHGRWRAASTMRGYLEEGTRTRPGNPSSNLGV